MNAILTPDEQVWIENNTDRCKSCGHLEIFHNYHCCEFCMVDGCDCEWRKTKKDRDADENLER